jgi:hypothetical protein
MKACRRQLLRPCARGGYLQAATAAVVALTLLGSSPAAAAEAGDSKTAGGLTVYLGVVPAEIVKGQHPAGPQVHGGVPKGAHEYHVVAAVFDAASNARIPDATVSAKVSGLGLSGPQKTLEPMKIADTITYGAFFNLSADLYTVKLTVQRPGSQPVAFEFKYDHRR